MFRLLRRELSRWRPLLGGGLLLLLGCSASDIKVYPPGPGDTTTTVEVTITHAGTGEPIGVVATVVIGGEKATLTAGEQTVSVAAVPFGDADPPTQPLTVTAQGFVTYFDPALPLNATGVTDATVELEAADPALTGSLSGKVENMESGNPLTNVVVEFRPDIFGQPDVVKAATAKDGGYTVAGVPVGKTIVTATADGFLTAETRIVVIQDAGGSGNDPVNLKLVPTSSKVVVKGRVVDLITRDPVKDASVQIGGVGPEPTDAQGRFQVAEVPVGQQVLQVSATGYDPFSDTITVAPGVPDLRIELAPTQSGPPPGPWTISGTVTIHNNPSNAGATVKAINTQTGKVIDTAITDSDGHYYLWVPPGTYRVEASFKGVTVPSTVTLGGAGRKLTHVDFEITAP